MAAPELGYNIAFKIGNKTLAGRTQDDLTITPTIKESITMTPGTRTSRSPDRRSPSPARAWSTSPSTAATPLPG